MRNKKFIKKLKYLFSYKESLFIFFAVLLSVFIFLSSIKAACPDSPCNPAEWTNIGICTYPPNPVFDGFGNASVYYTTSGQNMIHHWVKIFSDVAMTQLVFDSGFLENIPGAPLAPGTYFYAVPPGTLFSSSSYYYKAAVQTSYNNEWTPWATGVLCNHPPTPVPQVAVQPDYCVVDSPSVTLSWTFNDSKTGGDTLSAYQIQISEDSGFSTLLVDTGKVSSGSNTSFATSAIAWNKTYYWRVKIWDSCDTVSNSGNWTNGPSFSTISHAKPRPNFNWFPLNPAPNETVLFRDESVAYGGYVIADSRVWTFQDSAMVRPHEISPIVKFNSIGPKTVTLTATDTSPEAFTCTASKTVAVGIGAATGSNLPCWREINPH